MADDLTGKRFGKLLVLSKGEKNKTGSARWACKCDCGGEALSTAWNLKSGRATSCGCFRKEGVTERNSKGKHGKSRTPTSKIWIGMRSRCNDPKNKNYHRYGGRGIKVCERWDSFENFLADMGERPEGLSIERIENDGNYEPGNCKWATREEQQNNKRNNVHIEHEGQMLSPKEYAEVTGIPVARVYKHKAKGKL